MKVIDSDDYVASGIETFFFHGGEPHARVPLQFGDALLFLKARTWNDFGLALCVIDALRRQGSVVYVFAAYLPGARQDRTDGQTPLTASIYMSALENADAVFTFDAHSDVTARRVVHNYMPADLLRWSTEDLTIIAPDKGAVSRAYQFASMIMGYDGRKGLIQTVCCEKKRDFATGKFTGFEMPELPKTKGYLIVDDICDGGGTFNLLAEEFDRRMPKEAKLGLWVSHGIFSKGVRAISRRIEQIYTTDSWCSDQLYDDRLEVVPLQRIIDRIIEEREDA